MKRNYLTSDEIVYIVNEARKLPEGSRRIILVNGMIYQICFDYKSLGIRATTCNHIYDECIKEGWKASDIVNYQDVIEALKLETSFEAFVAQTIGNEIVKKENEE